MKFKKFYTVKKAVGHGNKGAIVNKSGSASNKMVVTIESN